MKLVSEGTSFRRITSVLLVLITVFFEATKSMVCKNDLTCKRMNSESCCVAFGNAFGVCSPKGQLGEKCRKHVKFTDLITGGRALNSCGCAKGLTCTPIKKKRRKYKKGKKAYRIKYKCMPIKINREISESGYSL